LSLLRDNYDPHQIDTLMMSGSLGALSDVDPEHDLNAQISRHRAIIGRMNETREAEQEITGVDDEGVTWRQFEAMRALEDAGRMGFDDKEDDGEESARNSAYLTQMVEEARKNLKKS